MSEKVTFGELVAAIAEETDNSEQFTHDFIKDFVDVINGGLEDDERVNIAGFGKFKLRRVDERDGYNPQTEEKITIPAHNKIVFKPYKDLREVVNAPYAHLESELIENDESNGNSQDEEAESTEAKSGEDDFIPTGPTTSQDSLNDENESIAGAGFELDIEAQESPYAPIDTSIAEDDKSDIVEFDADESENEDDIDEELNEFLGAEESTDGDEKKEAENSDVAEQDASQGVSNSAEESGDAEEQPPSEEQPEEEIAVKNTDNETSLAPTIGATEAEGKRTNSLPMLVAAGFLLLIVGGAAWYFSTLPTGNSPQMAAQEETTKATAPTASQKDDPTQPADEAAANPANGSTTQQTTANAAATPNQSSQEKERVEHQIEKGQTLWSLAEDNYGNPRLWPWIYGTNDKLADPDKILAGSSLAVPLPSGPQNQLNAADSVGVAKGFLATYQWYNQHKSSKAKNHLWAAKSYHHDVTNIADITIDESDLAYANRAR